MFFAPRILASFSLSIGRFRRAMVATLGVLCLGCMLAPASALSDPGAQSASRSAGGALKVKVVGLPRDERGRVVVSGPKGYRKLVARTTKLRGLQAGRYRIAVANTVIRRSRKGLKRGAVASPLRKRFSVRVRKARTATVKAGYGTIINPGVVKAPKTVSKVLGSPDQPTGLILRGKRRFSRDAILSSAPGGPFPKGLLAHVTSARFKGGRTTVTLRSASIYEVAPNMSFNVPLKAVIPASSSDFKCDSASGVKPYKRIEDGRASGSWNTVSVLGRDIPVGVRLNAVFTAEVGVEVTKALGGSCALSSPSVALQGVAGFIPVYGSVSGDLHAGASAGVTITSGGSAKFGIGASTVGLPPTPLWEPHVSVDSPEFNISAQPEAEVTAGIGVRGEIGVGVAGAGNVHLVLDNTLDFSAKPGACSWDVDLSSFAAGGKLGPWDISTPSTPPVFHKNLWRGCDGGDPGDPPAPPGDPPAPPADPPAPPPRFASTLGVFIPRGGTDALWNLRYANSAGPPNASLGYGGPGAQPVTGDWDADGDTTVGVFIPRGGTDAIWNLRNTNNAGPPDISTHYGGPGAKPVAGDWDGNGTTTIGVFDPVTRVWSLRNSNTAGPPDIQFQFGGPGAQPVVGDWDGNGTTTVGVFYPRDGTDAIWDLRNTNNAGPADASLHFGGPGAQPVTGDWDNDGDTTIGVFIPRDGNDAIWALRNGNTSGPADITTQFGGPGAVPVVGRWGRP